MRFNTCFESSFVHSIDSEAKRCRLADEVDSDCTRKIFAVHHAANVRFNGEKCKEILSIFLYFTFAFHLHFHIDKRCLLYCLI